MAASPSGTRCPGRQSPASRSRRESGGPYQGFEIDFGKSARSCREPGRQRRYSARVSPTLADVFAADPRAAVLRLLESAGTPLSATEIKQALVSSGIVRADLDRKWPAVQAELRADPRVVVEGRLYRWVAQPGPAQSPDEPAFVDTDEVDAFAALDLLLQGGLGRAKTAELVEIVRTTLKTNDDRESAARLRQAEMDGLRSLGELAGEVEELVANEVEPGILVRRVRARLKRSGLEPIDRAGEETAFDRKVHTPIAGTIRDGAPVTVVRPGYVWTGDGISLLIGKAVVEE